VAGGNRAAASAYAGVTDLLLEHEKSATPGVYTAFAKQGAYAEALDAVRVRFFELNARLKGEGLDVEAADRFIGERVAGVLGYLNSTAALLASGYISRSELLSAARELLASIGESHSAYKSRWRASRCA
jgi:aspartate kinase